MSDDQIIRLLESIESSLQYLVAEVSGISDVTTRLSSIEDEIDRVRRAVRQLGD